MVSKIIGATLRCPSSWDEEQIEQRLGHTELLNYRSTVFFVPNASNPLVCPIALRVGQVQRNIQKRLLLQGLPGIVGLTPRFPAFNPNASKEENCVYERSFERKCKDARLPYLPCLGTARDFPTDRGCYLVFAAPSQVLQVLNGSQYAIAYLPVLGHTHLIWGLS